MLFVVPVVTDSDDDGDKDNDKDSVGRRIVYLIFLQVRERNSPNIVARRQLDDIV